MSSKVETSTVNGEMDRRTLIKTVGVAGGLAMAGGVAHNRGWAPVQEAEAVAPVVLGGAVVGGIVVGWALRSVEPLSGDSASSGLSASALEQQCYQIAVTRDSNDDSTFVDNRNIIDGIDFSLYSDAKLAALEEINNGSTKAAVETAATSVVEARVATIQKNLLKSWNESVSELDGMLSTLTSHSGTNPSNVLQAWSEGGKASDGDAVVSSLDQHSATLVDGTTFSVHAIQNTQSGSEWTSPVSNSGDTWYVRAVYGSEPDVNYLQSTGAWKTLYDDITALGTSVTNDVINFVDNTYDSVQSGDVSTADLLNSTDLANMTTDDSAFPQSAADLMAMNIATDLDREAVIELQSGDITLTGRLSRTSSGSLTSGTVNPANETGDIYFTYDLAEGSGLWRDYDDSKGVDGGEVHFTSEPYADTVFDIRTVSDETASVRRSDFVAYDSSDNQVPLDDPTATYWEVDVSSQLSDPIADIAYVEMFADVTETTYQTIKLVDPFTIVEFLDAEGTSYTKTTFEQEKTHTDTNYITDSEWTALEEQQQQLIDLYESDTSSGGSLLGGGSWLGGGLFGGVSIGALLTGGVALFVFVLVVMLLIAFMKGR